MKIEVTKPNIRFDKYLSDNSEYSRSIVEKMVENDLVLVNGKKIKSSSKLKEGDIIEVLGEYVEEIYLEPVQMDIDIVYEDDDILVVNKQSGLVVHPGSGNKNNTLVNGLLFHTTNLSDQNGETRPGIVHRIDKDTSGLMLVAKNNKAHSILVEDFKNKNVKREYIAVVEGIFPSDKAKINAPIGKSKLDFRKQEVKEDGKVAVTNLCVEKRAKKYTVLRLSLETGRTHQIRVHLEYIGYPIVNDPVYNVRPSTNFGQFLHSTSVEFIHPITKEKMHFDAPVPNVMQEFIDSLD